MESGKRSKFRGARAMVLEERVMLVELYVQSALRSRQLVACLLSLRDIRF